MTRTYGTIKSFSTAYTLKGLIRFSNRTRSFTLLNQGSTDVILFSNSTGLKLNPGDSITFGGYDDSIRVDEIEFDFSAVPGSLLIMIQDTINTEPSYIKSDGLA